MHKRIMILAAMDSEIAPIRKKMILEKEEHHRKFSVYWGEYVNHKVLLIRSGVGKKNTLRVLKAGFSDGAHLVINIGLAGAILPYLKIGDVIVPEILRNRYIKDKYYKVDQGLLKKMDHLPGRGIYKADLMTTSIICSKKEKEELLREYPLLGAVDMESFYISEYCTENRVPFLGLRAISDTVDFTFPSYCLIKDKFHISEYPKILKTCLLHPTEMIAAVRLKWNVTMAAHRNCALMERYLAIL